MSTEQLAPEINLKSHFRAEGVRFAREALKQKETNYTSYLSHAKTAEMFLSLSDKL